MSLVGPHPGLFNQQALTAEREQHGVYTMRPGITGLAQVYGIDMSTPALLAETDHKMFSELSSRCVITSALFFNLGGQGVW
jgi:lipopolysaccharide/colanic/teichoic acid biosynthesis glycosyltransferase